MPLDSTDPHIREKILRALIEHSQDVVTVLAVDGTMLFKSAVAQKALGYAPAELSGQNAFKFLHPADQGAARAYLASIFNGESCEAPLEYRFQHRDGSWRHFEARITLLDEIVGGQPSVVIISRDVSERKQAEAALSESEARKTAIFETALDAIIIMNAAGNVVEWNAAAEQIFGYTCEEAVGMPMADLIVPNFMSATHQASVERYLEDHQKHILDRRVELPARCKNGEEITVEVIATRLSTIGEPLFAGFMRDTTKQKRAEAALLESKAEAERAREEAERANFAKSEFLSRMSHELRTPLNAILGFSQVLQMDPDAAPFRDVSDDIYDAGKHLLSLINEVLDISRIEAGTITLSTEPVAVAEAAGEALALIAPLASARGLTTRVSSATQCPAYVLADRQRLTQCLLNLLSNAVKYNRDGGSIEMECHDCHTFETSFDNSLARMLTISVRDTGVGIAPGKLPRLFTPFDRLDADRTDIEGTGLGLALTKKLVEEMGGQLLVESTPGVGSKFSMRLPLADGESASIENEVPEHVYASDDPQHCSLLLIEDNPLNVRVIKRVLQRRPKTTLLVATQGQQGLEMAHRHLPDVIVLDLHLPDMEGSEVWHCLKTDAATRKIPVLVLSADATPGKIAQLKNSGVRDYFTKPLNVSQFLNTLDQILPSNDTATR